MQTNGVTVGSEGVHVTLAPVPGSDRRAAPQGAQPQTATLVLKDVKLLSRPPAPLHVFLNLPEGTPPDLNSPFHVGILNFFNWDTGTGGPMQHGPGEADHAMPSSGEFRFAVGQLLARQMAENLWRGGPITMTVSTLGADRSRGRTYVKIGQVQLEP
jgi:tyrosinase